MKTSMKTKCLGWAAAAVLAFIGTSSSAHADTAFTMSPGAVYTNGTWSLGFEFTANSAINVTELGYFDDNGDGLAQSHNVGIFNIGGTLLASTTVTNADSLDNLFRYHAITPLGLIAGQNYVIAATTGFENYTYNPTAFATAPEITFVANRYDSSNTLIFPTVMQDDLVGWFGPNFKFERSVVPEPSAWISAATAGLMGLGVVRRRRRAA